MNRFILVIVLFCSLVFQSCQFSENIYINEDGSGKMEFSFDGSQFMQMAGDNIAESGEKAIDSTFSFKDLLLAKSDSISKLTEDEQQKLKSLEPFSMHMVMNPETSEMKFNLLTEFKTVNELQDMFKAMKNFGDLKGKEKTGNAANPMPSFGSDENTELNYNFNGKTFTRTAKVLDKEAYEKATDSLGQMTMMFGTSVYKLNYHFPKPIKSVSNERALFSADRKRVTVEYSLLDYLANPEALNLEVVLED